MINYLRPDKDGCGFQIEDWRKKVWNIELGLSQILDKICVENGLKYFLVGGGAIGAVRHQGFIPWDDDLDFGMLRSDFDKLLKILSSRNNKQDDISIQYGTTGKFFSLLLRIRDNNSTGIVADEIGYPEMCHGVFIEVYPFDYVPEKKILRRIQLFRSRIFTAFLYAKMHSENKSLLCLTLRFFSIWSSSAKIWDKLQRNSTKYNANYHKLVDTPSLAHYYKLGIHCFEAEWVQSTVYHRFESIELPLGIKNDLCLKIQYGDYMVLPPDSERGQNHQDKVIYDPDEPYFQKIINGRFYIIDHINPRQNKNE